MAKQTKFTDDDLSKKGFIKNAFGQYEKLQKGETIENGNVMVKPIRVGRKPHKEVQEEIYEDVKKAFDKLVNSELLPIDSLLFAWEGKHIGWNTLYSTPHWTIRNKKVKEWHTFFKKMILKGQPPIGQYKLLLEYNSRLDPTNVTLMPKLLEDTLQEAGIITNDTKEVCRELKVVPKEDMPKKSYKITIIPC